MKGKKSLVYDFKVSLARLWHGTSQRERKITLHTWSIKENSLWNGLLGRIQSGTSHGIDGTASGCADAWPEQDGCWAGISGHRPILWELLSHAVWRRNWWSWQHTRAATLRVLFQSKKNSRDVLVFSHQADRDEFLTINFVPSLFIPPPPVVNHSLI